MIKAVVLLSGGLDSSVCLGLARQKHSNDEIMALNLQYGQKHAIEQEAAKKVADHFGVILHQIQLPNFLFAGGGSTLIDPHCQTPEMTYEQMANAGPGVSPTYVPFRNSNLLSAATAFALSKCGAKPEAQVDLYYGAHAEDAANWAYPC